MAVINGGTSLGGVFMYNAAAIPGPPGSWCVNAAPRTRDFEYGGAGTITGTTEAQTSASTSVPVGNCRVWLVDRKSGYVVRQVFSDAAGNYLIENIKPGSYIAVAFDPGDTYDTASTQMVEVV